MPISGVDLKIIGHRGWPTRYPDNVLAGIEAAAAVAEMVEVDVRCTADGVLVLAHDGHLGDHEVALSSWSDLENVDLGGGHHPLTLDALLAAFPDFPFNLEIKNFPGDYGFDAEHGHGLETAEHARPGDLLTCFNWVTVDILRTSHPDVATGLLIDEGWSLTDAVDHALARGHVAVVPHWQLARAQPAAVATAVEAGLVVAVWTLNDPVIANELAMVGVSAIITDDPGEMHRALREKS